MSSFSPINGFLRILINQFYILKRCRKMIFNGGKIQETSEVNSLSKTKI